MFDQDSYQRFLDRYQDSVPPPWDTGTVPPEVVALVTGPDAPPPGRALDVGCGTGTNSVYLAQHGWQVTGVDFIPLALDRARARAAAASLDEARVRFVAADISDPGFLPDHPPVSFWLDIGCLHSLQPSDQPTYAEHAHRLIAPGGRLLLYAFCPYLRLRDGRPRGVDPATVEDSFRPAFAIERVQHGFEANANDRASAWYWLRRR